MILPRSTEIIALVASLLVITAIAKDIQTQNVEVQGGWVVSMKINPMDSVKTVSAMHDSVEQPAANLVIRCKGQHAEVYIDAKEVVSAEYGVRIKFDDGKSVRQSWQRAASYDALFSPSPSDFLRSMKSAKIFYFEYTPYQKVARVVSFDVNNLPNSLSTACVSAEIDRSDARSKKAAEQRTKELARQTQEREENEKRLAVLRTKCAPFANESVDQVERSETPMPPQECWEVLEWMHSAVSYDDLANRRELCKLPSFARDPKFCEAHPSPERAAVENTNADDKLIMQTLNDSVAKSALKDNCSHKWFSDLHPRACEWANSQTGK